MNKYENLIKKIKKDFKKYNTLAQTTKEEDYQFAFNMLANYLEEILDIEEGN